MNIIIIDGQGGGIGKQLVSAIKKSCTNSVITAIGTNSLATAAMLKAGADNVATGENAVVVCCRRADIIVGPLGIVIADAMFGEITPAMALAVGQSKAVRVLIPVKHCDNIVAGVSQQSMSKFIDDVVMQINLL